jgi:LPXTG-motif cell wall-anchored protein
MDTIRFENGSRLALNPANYFGRNWYVDPDNRIDIQGPASMSTVSFVAAGTVRLNSPSSPDQLHSTVGQEWYSDGGTLAMSASTDTDKNFLSIDGAAMIKPMTVPDYTPAAAKAKKSGKSGKSGQTGRAGKAGPKAAAPPRGAPASAAPSAPASAAPSASARPAARAVPSALRAEPAPGQPGSPVTIDLDLNKNWNGDRINLVRSASPSDETAFRMDPIRIINDQFRGHAVLKNELNADNQGRTWYIEGEKETPYRVTVHHGTLPGDLTTDLFFADEHVAVKADAPAKGMRFKGWEINQGGPLTGFDPTDPDASFTMPSRDVVLTALYEPLPTPSPTPTPTPTHTTSPHPAPTHSPGGGGMASTGSTWLPALAIAGAAIIAGLALFQLRRRNLRRG